MAELNATNRSSFQDTVHAAQGLGVIALTYNWLAEAVNLIGNLLMPDRTSALIPPLFDFPLDPGFLWPVLWPVWHCVIVGFITYVLIERVCRAEWVKRTYVIRECVQVNPFGIVFCFLKVVSVWVLVVICRWRYHIVSIPIWICFLVWIWRLF